VTIPKTSVVRVCTVTTEIVVVGVDRVNKLPQTLISALPNTIDAIMPQANAVRVSIVTRVIVVVGVAVYEPIILLRLLLTHVLLCTIDVMMIKISVVRAFIVTRVIVGVGVVVVVDGKKYYYKGCRYSSTQKRDDSDTVFFVWAPRVSWLRYHVQCDAACTGRLYTIY